MRIGLGVGAAFDAARRTRARDQARERFARIGREAERAQALQDHLRGVRREARNQHALPRRQHEPALGVRGGELYLLSWGIDRAKVSQRKDAPTTKQ